MGKRTKPAIVWAVDPFESDGTGFANALLFARAWSQGRSLRVVPAYVLSSRQIGFAYEYEFDSPRFIAARARDLFAERIRLLHSENGSAEEPLEELRVLSTASWTLGHDVQVLQEFAHDEGAEAILISTHGRGGLKRAFLGSFAEAALLYSATPVITTNPRFRSSERVRRILFPTEFGRYSGQVFGRVLKLAQELKASISMLHVLPALPGAALLGGFPTDPTLPIDLIASAKSAETAKAERAFRLWEEEARRMGVSIDSTVIDSRDGIAESILGAARRVDCHLIAMESESGRVRSALVGSVCRNVSRLASCPLWVIRASLALQEFKRGAGPGYELQAA